MTNKPIISAIRNIGSETIDTLYTKDLPILEEPNHYVLFADTSTLFIDNGRHQLTRSYFTGNVSFWHYREGYKEGDLREDRTVIVLNEGVVNENPDRAPGWYAESGIATDYWTVKFTHPTYIDLIQTDWVLKKLIIDRVVYRISLSNSDISIAAIASDLLKEYNQRDVSELILGLAELKSIVSSHFVQYDSTFDINQYDIFKDIK